MLEKLKQKLQSRAGESIGETLVSLLIAALALVMLAGAISASSGVIMKSRDKLNDYYSANEEASGVVKMTSGGSTVTDGITIKDTIEDNTRAISDQSFKVTYYKNDKFGKKTVVAYELSD
jgi:hypothetical protein